MSANEKIRNMVRAWLRLEPYSRQSQITIKEFNTHETNMIRNALWYRGDPTELHQFYNKIDDGMGNSSFWRATSSTGVEFRKIHTGLPALIIDKLVDIVVNDMNDIEFLTNETDQKTGKYKEDIASKQRWEVIEAEHDFKDKTLKRAVKDMLIYGDSAVKGSYDKTVSDFPLIEVVPGVDIDFEYVRGRCIAVNFYFKKFIDNKEYVLNEHYEQGGVRYTLYDKDGHDVSVGLIEQLYDLYPIEYDGRFIMAVPLMMNESEQFKGRGKSIFDGKTGAFDSFDESWSQWIEALRDGRTNRYIPENLIPRDPNTGILMTPRTFDNRFIAVGSDLREGAQNKIEVDTPDIQSDQYLAAYVTALDLCLQGLISPSTLGIDVKKLDNAEAQREKEKTTLYTRTKIVDVLEKAVPKIVEMTLKMDDLINERDLGQYNISVNFGEYANPSFEAQVETIGKAKQQGVMSIETLVEQLYGDTWTDQQKKEEVQRLKKEQGYEVEEPSVPSLDTEKEVLDNGSEETV